MSGERAARQWRARSRARVVPSTKATTKAGTSCDPSLRRSGRARTKLSCPAVSSGEEVIVVERAALRERGRTLGGEQTTERTC